MSETQYPTLKMEFVAKIFDPVFKYLDDRGITGTIVPLLLLTIYAFFLFRNRPRKKQITIEEILVILGWILCFVVTVIEQYDIIIK